MALTAPATPQAAPTLRTIRSPAGGEENSYDRSMDTATAIVRGVPDTFDAALVMGERPKLEVAKARKQHANYCTHLAKAGYELAELPADDDYPDCLFVEDTAVVIGRVAVICRSGASARRGEVGPVADRLATTFELRPIVEPGTIDGGDVPREPRMKTLLGRVPPGRRHRGAGKGELREQKQE